MLRALPLALFAFLLVPALAHADDARPKVSIVVSGDADETLRSAARRVDEALSSRAPVALVADPAIAAALRGEPLGEEDGTERLRAERRRLGLSEASDVPALTRIGRASSARFLAVVRASDAGAELVVFDVRERAFYEGALPLDAATPTAIRRFVTRRSRVVPRPAAAAAASPDPRFVTNEPEDSTFLEDAIPYAVVVALAGAGVAFLLLSDSPDDPGPPVLRFRPGGGE